MATKTTSPLVSAERLQSRLDDGEDIVLLDVSWQLGAESQRPAYDV